MTRSFWPALIAAADSVAIMGYILAIDPAILQVGALAIKLAAVPWLLRRDSIIVIQLPVYMALVSLCLISLAFASIPQPSAIVQIIGFLIHLALTLLLLVEEFPAYLGSIAYLTAGSAVIYLGYAALGAIEIIWGRHFYFNEIHPNVGGEIAAAGVLCAAISLPIRRFLIVAAPMFASAFLMQARSALLTIALSVMLRGARELYTTSQSRRTQWWTLFMSPFATAGLVIGTPYVVDAMQLDSTYRGIDSGLSGRGDQWKMAWDAFMERPLTGQGLGWISETQDLGAHQFFLYGLAEMGLLSVLVFVGMLLLAGRSFAIHGWKLAAIAPVFVMTFANDRYINLNLYPYILWVFLFSLSARTWVVGATQTPVARIKWLAIRATST